ncbi:MAG: flagellar filament capping protein FliD [Desulfamplus sp.]|nr:flagellar filament capping protein FliD [Desulfamplus sp.]
MVLSSKNTGEENRITMESQLSGLKLTETNGAGRLPPVSDSPVTIGANNPITVGVGAIPVSDNGITISATDPPVSISDAGGNNKIVFRERLENGELGEEKTATIADGNYTDGDALAAAIKSAMEAASTNGTKFAVGFDSGTGKFTINEDGATLHELQIAWDKSNAASALGFDAKADIYRPHDNSENNKIVFRERLANGELGEEKTATIADGNYTNGDALAAAIKSAMEAASQNGVKFSVLFNSDIKKFTIKEDGSNLHELQIAWGKSSAASALGFDSTTDVYDPYNSKSILNAQFTVDGIDYQRQSNNEITDVVSGISLDLKETGSSSFNVDSDFEKVQTNLEEIVSTLNTLITDTKSKSKYDINTKEKGILFGESSVLRISEDIKTLMGQKFDTGGEISTLYDLGLEIEKDGTLSINTTTLQKAFSSNSEDVIKFFTGDSEKKRDGFGDMLYEKMTKYTGSTGLMTVEIDTAQARISKMDLEIQEDTKRLDQRYESLTKQFVKLDSFMSQMKSQSSFLDMMFNTNKKDT